MRRERDGYEGMEWEWGVLVVIPYPSFDPDEPHSRNSFFR